MAKSNNLVFALNGGEISRYALGRVDLAKMRMAASTMVNCIPRVIGPYQFRPGTVYRTTTQGNRPARIIPFIFSAEDTAQIELTDSTLRPLIAGQPITRVAVATAITSGDFSSATGWTLTASAGATAQVTGGQLSLDTIVRGSTASAAQQVAVAGGDIGKEHAIRVIVARGPVALRVGQSNGTDEYIVETQLQDGTHSLAFTPTGNFWVQFSAMGHADRRVESAVIEPAGTLTLDTPWPASELRALRYDQSADVIYVADRGYYTRRIERRGVHSWSLVRHPLNDGPFGVGRSALVKLTAGATEGITTLSSDGPFFAPNHVGALFRLNHEGVSQTVTLGAEDTWSPVLRVHGIESENDLGLAITGVWAGTIYLQRSVDGPDSGFADTGSTWTTNTGGFGFHPGTAWDNVIHYYRLGFRPGHYTSGAAQVTVAYSAGGSVLAAAGGSGSGVCRVIGYTSPTQVTVEIITPMVSTKATDDWNEGIWSDRNGWPSAVALHEGRLWLGNADKIDGSVSDAFDSYDDTVVGDAGPIERSIATGPVNRALWCLSLGRLVIGTSGSASVPRSSSFDEPMTPTNFTIKDASTQGSADVQAVKVDRNGIFVQRSGRRVYELAYDSMAMDYVPNDLTKFNPDIASTGIVEQAVQRQPDTRVWNVRADGQMAVLLYEKQEDVFAWTRFVTDGAVTSICTTPNTQQDDLWMVVKRTVGGVDNYYVERMSYDLNAIGGAANEMCDCAVIYGAVGSATLTGLDHLEGRSVIAWADGKPMDGTFTVTAGRITLPAVVAAGAVVGLTYTGQWRSTKLAYASELGTAVGQKKRVDQIGVLLADTHWRGTTFGSDFAKAMDTVPARLEGRILNRDEILGDYDEGMFPLPGDWNTDSRVCIAHQAPFPATVLALVLGVATHDKG